MHRILLFVMLLSLCQLAQAEGIDAYILKESDLPSGAVMLEPTARMPKYWNETNPSIITDEDDLKGFCAGYLRDESFAKKLAGVASTKIKIPQRCELLVYELRDKNGVAELRKQCDWMLSHTTYHRFMESGRFLILLWSEDNPPETLEAIEAVLKERIKNVDKG